MSEWTEAGPRSSRKRENQQQRSWPLAPQHTDGLHAADPLLAVARVLARCPCLCRHVLDPAWQVERKGLRLPRRMATLVGRIISCISMHAAAAVDSLRRNSDVRAPVARWAPTR